MGKKPKETNNTTVLERRLAGVPLSDNLRNYVRLTMKDPSAATARQDAELKNELVEMATTGAVKGHYLPCSSKDLKNVKMAAQDLIKTLSTRTKSPKQVFIENNPLLLVLEVNSYLAILKRHAAGKRDTSGAERYDAKKSTRRTDGIKAALDEMIKSTEVTIRDNHGDGVVEVPVDGRLSKAILNNKKRWIDKPQFHKSLENIACDIFAKKNNFAYDRTTEIYQKYKPQTPIAETGNRIADPGYFNKDFKLIPNKSSYKVPQGDEGNEEWVVQLPNSRYGLFVPYDPKAFPATNKKGPLPGAKVSTKKRK